MVVGIALAVGGLLLSIATQWDSFGESSQRCPVTGWIGTWAGCLVAGCGVRVVS